MITKCTNCGFDNPPGMRFCGNCGARLANSLPSAGSAAAVSLPAAEVTAESLGIMMGADLAQRMQAAGLDAAGQRRNVTVVFADLSGYTTLSEQLDGEDLYEIIQQYIRLLLNNISKYEGIVDKLTGDGLMALFGAPIAHENNAERAVRAALDMQSDVLEFSRALKRQLGIELKMRVGLHAGAVVVGGVGSNLLMDYTAIGDTVNLARRIEESAPPGAILVSESVYRLTRVLFEYQQISVLNPKGITQPVVAFRVLGLRSSPGIVRGVEGLRAPMIGRDQELEQLKKALSIFITRKQGQFFMVTGEAGLGKSRLKAEFKAVLRQYPVRVLEGQSQAYRRSISYWIFLDVLFSLLQVNQTTPQPQVRERLIQTVYQALGSQAAEVLPYFEQLLSLPYSDIAAAERVRFLDAGQLRQQIFLAVRDLLLAEAARRPLLLILEDLHWADEASLELLRFLVESLRKAPISILAITRLIQPGSMLRTVEWAQNYLIGRFHHIPIQSLSELESQQLLSQLLTISNLPEKLHEQILQRAAGIPFYLEEILRMLIDEGIIQRETDHWRLAAGTDSLAIGVPETLHDLILARVDRLDPMLRRILQIASVIGKNFSLPVLNAVLQPASAGDLHANLAALVEREFLLPQPDGPEQEYSFRHILMSDAIYATLLRRERSKLHGRVGEAIEVLYSDRLEGQIELLAHHYRWSTQLDRALHYLILAGQKAIRNYVNEQARQHLEAALELLPQINYHPYQAMQAQMGLGDVLLFTGDYQTARQHYLTAMQTIKQSQDGFYPEERSVLLRKIAKTCERQGDYEQALAYLAEARAALEDSPITMPVELAQVWNDLGWVHFRRGSFAEAQQLLQQALGLVEATDAYDAIASIYNRLGGIAYNQGEWDGAARFLRKSIAIRESIHDVVGLATSFNNLGLLEIEMGEYDNALENLTRSYELKTRLGQAEGIAMALNNLAWLRIQRGELVEAGQDLDQALELASQIGYSSLLRQILKNFGELHLAAGRWEKAQQVLAEDTAGLSEQAALDELIDTYRLLGEAALGCGDLAAAQGWAQQAEELIASLGNEADELSAIQRGEIRLFRGRLAIQRREWDLAAKALRESETIFQKLRSRLHLGRVSYQLGVLAESMADQRTAQLRFREAALLFQSIGAKLEEQRAEQARLHQ